MIISPQRIRGHFFSSDSERGIAFDMDHHSLSISTLQGERLLTSKQHVRLGEVTPLAGISLLQHHFLVNLDGSEEYVVPRHLHSYFEAILRDVVLFGHLRRHLDEEGVNVTRSVAIGQLLAREEALLMVQAAMALGERGIRGADNPAAMMLYMVALRIKDMLDSGSGEEVSSHHLAKRTVEHNIDVAYGQEYCSNTADTCPTSQCPQGEECTGLCGISCSCWEWVCGNCCLNKMCLDHDTYCMKGHLSWCCLGIINQLGSLSCNQPYTCPKQS
jgi:hypothetical protein